VKSRILSVLTVLVGSFVVIVLISAVTIPSLLRARVAGPRPRPEAQEPAPLRVPAPTTAAPEALAQPPAHGIVGFEDKRAGEREWRMRRPPTMNTEAYERVVDNAFQDVATSPLSTFSIDVDTASYANVRRFLTQGQLPPPDAVRVEELVNYFHFEYPPPEGDAPFAITTSVATCPWAPAHRLVRIGLQARAIARDQLPPRNLVFLIDVSGSMQDPVKLPLVKSALSLLVDQLDERDRVSIVVYAGSSGLVLPPTSGDRKGEIRGVLSQLEAGGSTAGGAGLQLAYKVAEQSFIERGMNRVILATDGDFNVGITSRGDLSRLIEDKRKAGVFLSVLGFGMGNLKDSTMEMLADKGNGNYAYIDSLDEARKVLVSEVGSTLVTVAKDVKLQVEFNPATVSAYRLIGYENRVLADADFNDDTKDAGDMGAGHSVTALYEVVPGGTPHTARSVDPLKYQETRGVSAAAASGELMTVKVRYKAPESETSRLVSVTVNGSATPTAAEAADLRFAAAVAGFGMLLRDSEYKGTASFDQVLELAHGSDGQDASGYRAEFIRLVETAQQLSRSREARLSR
jgi:Ca-activated chloride channel homolog